MLFFGFIGWLENKRGQNIMKNQSEPNKEALDTCEKLEDLFNEKIIELNKSVGGISSRHAYCYYRELIWQIMSLLRTTKQRKNTTFSRKDI